MTPDEFHEFRHRAVHELMDLNADCEAKFRIGHWERWVYDLDAGTLIFSESGVPKVIAAIQVVGTTSTAFENMDVELGEPEPSLIGERPPSRCARIGN